jgi:two-component system, LytTR family, response regulator
MHTDTVRDAVTAPLLVLIVDDEVLARRGLRLRLNAIDGVTVVGECANGREALASIAAQAPDLVFLDIQMPGSSGFDVVRELQADAMPLIVFVTAFDQYAVKAFDIHAVDYLLKPVEQSRLEEAVRRARAKLAAVRAIDEKSQLMNLIVALAGDSEPTMGTLPGGRANAQFGERLTVRDGNRAILVQMHDIEWIDAAGDYMCIHAQGKTYVMRVTMKELEALLDPALFLRIHRSTLVNAAHIVEIVPHDNGEFFISLDRGTRLKVSRGYRDRIARFL